MKRLKMLGLAAMAAGMFSLTSCLGGGGNKQQLSQFAIVDYSSTMRTLIYPLGYYPLFISTIANDPSYNPGDCVIANFTVDFDSEENANATANGFYVATGVATSPLAKYSLNFTPLDSTVLNNELLLSGAEAGLMMSANYKKIIAVPAFESALTGQKNDYVLTMDYDQKPVNIEGVDRVYTLCLRAQKREDGKAPTINGPQDPISAEGGSLYNLLKSKELAADKKVANFRVMYPSKFNSDSTKIATWSYSKVSQFSIEEEKK